MKNLIMLCLAVFTSQVVFAQETPAAPADVKKEVEMEITKTKAVKKGAVATIPVEASVEGSAQFQVWGNCGMCKKTIEKAATKIDGVKSADWNAETHQFTVNFDPAATNVDKVHQAIAAAGYDTDKVRGDDKAYSKLHACCKYDRKE